VLPVAAKDGIGGFSAVQPYGVQPGGSQINAWMSDSGAIPIDDCGEFLGSPQKTITDNAYADPRSALHDLGRAYKPARSSQSGAR
jgi:hypothetical protein